MYLHIFGKAPDLIGVFILGVKRELDTIYKAVGRVSVIVKQKKEGDTMNEENLIPISERSTEEVREMGRKGGIASGKARREKKIFKEAIEKQLGQSIDSMIKSMITQAKNGNVQAITFLRDTIGEKPTDKVEAEVNSDVNINIELSDD